MNDNNKHTQDEKNSSLIKEILNIINTAFSLAKELYDLVKLEAKLAIRSSVFLVILTVIFLIWLVCFWLILIALSIVWLTTCGFSVQVAILMTGAGHCLLLIPFILLFRQYGKDLHFNATKRQLGIKEKYELKERN